MNGVFHKIAFSMALAFGVIGVAHAIPVTYDFTATDFVSESGLNPVPNSSLSGSLTIDGTTVIDINLTIGSHTYTSAEVGYLPDWIAGGIGTGFCADPNCIKSGTNDFWLAGVFGDTPSFSNIWYSVDGVQDTFHSYTGTLTIGSVPEPSSLALLGFALAGLGAVRRRKAK